MYSVYHFDKIFSYRGFASLFASQDLVHSFLALNRNERLVPVPIDDQIKFFADARAQGFTGVWKFSPDGTETFIDFKNQAG
jgi:hypothetical protein